MGRIFQTTNALPRKKWVDDVIMAPTRSQEETQGWQLGRGMPGEDEGEMKTQGWNGKQSKKDGKGGVMGGKLEKHCEDEGKGGSKDKPMLS